MVFVRVPLLSRTAKEVNEAMSDLKEVFESKERRENKRFLAS